MNLKCVPTWAQSRLQWWLLSAIRTHTEHEHDATCILVCPQQLSNQRGIRIPTIRKKTRNGELPRYSNKGAKPALYCLTHTFEFQNCIRDVEEFVAQIVQMTPEERENWRVRNAKSRHAIGGRTVIEINGVHRLTDPVFDLSYLRDPVARHRAHFYADVFWAIQSNVFPQEYWQRHFYKQIKERQAEWPPCDEGPADEEVIH